jgi:hypothetical protein
VDYTDKQYLLTYQTKDKEWGTFSWFDTEDEMYEFAEKNDINILEAIRINSVEKLI